MTTTEEQARADVQKQEDATPIDEPFILPEEDRAFVANVLYLYGKRLQELTGLREVSIEETRRMMAAVSRATILAQQINPQEDAWRVRRGEDPSRSRTGLRYPRRP